MPAPPGTTGTEQPARARDEKVDAREAEGLPISDYVIGADFIHAGVGWSDASVFVQTVGQLAWTYRLAVACLSEDGSILRL